MKQIQQFLSDFINLIFASNDPKENEKLQSWWTILAVFLFLIFIVIVLVLSS